MGDKLNLPIGLKNTHLNLSQMFYIKSNGVAWNPPRQTTCQNVPFNKPQSYCQLGRNVIV